MKLAPRVLMVTNTFPTREQPERGIFVRRLVEALDEEAGVPVRVVLVGRTGAGGVRSSRRAVLQGIAEFRPDLLHVYYGLSGAALPRGGGIPVVLSLCGSDVLGWTEGRSGRGLMEFAVSTVTAARSRIVIAQSAVVRQALPVWLRARVRLVPTGVDRTRFRPMDRAWSREQLGWNPEGSVVLFPANPDRPVKRWNLARRAVASLRSRHGIAAEIRTLGGVAPEMVPLHLNAADCVIVTSRWEAGPIVLQEALACGVPVVSVPVGYVASTRGQYGHLVVVDAGVDQLADALAHVFQARQASDNQEVVPILDQATWAATVSELYAEALA